MNYYLGAYAKISGFNHNIETKVWVCENDETHFKERDKSTNCNFCSICGGHIEEDITIKKSFSPSTLFNLDYYKILQIEKNIFNDITLGSECIWIIKDNNFGLNLDFYDNLEIPENFQENSLEYFKNKFKPYENFFKNNGIECSINFGFIGDI